MKVLDDEEVEYWDERDKTDYEMNKQFEKLTAETIAMREKMKKMQLAFRKAQGMNDCLYNMGAISSKTPIALPPKLPKLQNSQNSQLASRIHDKVERKAI